MNLPPHFQFDLKLARDCGWPVVTRDGQPFKVISFEGRLENFPILGYIGINRAISTAMADGAFNGERHHEYDLHLSSNTDDPAVRAAVEAAWKAGEPISVQWNEQGLKNLETRKPFWVSHNSLPFGWDERNFLPTRLLSQLPQPEKPAWTLPEPPPGQSWHRVDGWTREMLPEGWRPLLESEAAKPGDEYYGKYSQRWNPQDHEDSLSSTKHYEKIGTFHRTRRPLPAPVVYWSAPEHIPGPVCWLRHKTHHSKSTMLAVVHIIDKGMFIGNSAYVDFASIEDYDYSTDRINWFLCTLPAQ